MEILQIKFYEIEREKEIIIEVNLEKLSNVTAFKVFSREMWRIENDAADLTIKEESLTEALFAAGFSAIDERYVITMNRNFEEDQELMGTCTSIADRISEEIFRRRLTLSQFKNIVLWVKERYGKQRKAPV
uniref:Uncharacterized protein n=1 Tax=Panagrolaimus davidi TaxID=227884 RepID=A0A914QVB2_9BILA